MRGLTLPKDRRGLMLTTDTFLTAVYVEVDDFCKAHLASEHHPAPAASLTPSEVITLALLAQWGRFASERAFYRYAARQLKGAFPRLPDRTQFNRLVRQHEPGIVAFSLHLAERLGAAGGGAAYEALDSTGIPTRNAKRRGLGWLPGLADISWSNHLGWYEGFHLLTAVTPEGVITGFGFAPASTNDHALAETFFALRRTPAAAVPSAGRPAADCYVADTGFVGAQPHRHWREAYGARVICPPKRTSRTPWPRRLRRWVASLRQIVETVYERLEHTFRLARERPHSLRGFQARLAATTALHNCCIWLNRQLGRPDLAFADLVDW